MKQKFVLILALILFYLFVINLPWESQSSGITSILRIWGEEQAQTSEEITDAVVSSVEGAESFVGEHKINGANWSIPNILRHWFGAD